MANSRDLDLSPALAAIQTLPALFAWRVASTPDAEAYRYFDGDWRGVSWREAGAQVARFAAGLRRLHLPPGARVAILLPNGCNAVYMDQAALALGAVPVPMHALDNPASIAYILADSEAALLIVQSQAQWLAIVETGVALPGLGEVVIVEPATAVPAGVVPTRALDAWLAAGEAMSDADQPPAPSDLAAIVYTSGTTGKPKGVMLTHENVVSNVKASMRRIAPLPSDVFLSFLPLSHTFERTGGYYLPIAAGCAVAFARSTKQLPEDLKTVRPTVLISVPRIYERVYAGVEAMLAPSKLKSWLFATAQSVGWRRFCRQQGRPAGGVFVSLLDCCAWPVLDRLVANTLRQQFGGRLRLAVSGGAPLSQQIARCFLGLGLPIAQGYGMTETSPVIAVNAIGDNDPQTVGRPLPGVEIRIGENKELQVRGPSVMRGYWKRDEDTARAFIDGWLHTGDQAAVEDGRVRILGRVKEIIVTSTGEKIAPVDIELAILADTSFEQAYAFGDNRPFIACAVVLNRTYWAALAAELTLDVDDAASLGAQAARDAVCERIRALTHGFPYYAQPRAVILSLTPWTMENSLLTPTLKLKRANLAAHFAEQIEALYRH